MTELASPQRQSTEPPSPRSPGTSVQEYLDNDARPVPAVLRYDINENLGTEPLDVERYISREFHDREVEKVWRKVWQFACREDHIPNPGDHVTYDIADDKLIIMRQPDGTIKALYNVCLHRGRALRQEGGRVSELRCPFHGFSWNIDGTMKNLPCAWDFPEIDPTNFPLPEAKVATWNGFVFINQDPDAEPLEDFLGSMLNDWDRWDYDDRVVYSHFGGIVNCNWKVAGEAFIEGFHSLATHPQMMEWLGDENTQYDVIKGENWSRQIVPQGVPSPTIANHISEQEVLDSYYETRAFYTQGKGRDLAVGDDGTPRVPLRLHGPSRARRRHAVRARRAVRERPGPLDRLRAARRHPVLRLPELLRVRRALARTRSTASARWATTPTSASRRSSCSRSSPPTARTPSRPPRAGCSRGRRSPTSRRSACSARCSTRTWRTCRSSRRG